MKVPSNRFLKPFSVTAGAIVFVVGATVGLQSPQTKTLKLSDTTTPIDTTQTAPADGTATTTDPATPQTTTSPTSTDATTPADTTAPTDQTSAPATGTTSTSSSSPSGTTAPTPPPVTATSADLSEFTADQPTGNSDGSTVKYQYCNFGYSDGSTKQVLYKTVYTYPNQKGMGASATVFGSTDCRVSAAPAP